MTFKLVESDIKSASDVIIALTHWFLVKNGGLRCLGVGDDVSTLLLLYPSILYHYTTNAVVFNNFII